MVKKQGVLSAKNIAAIGVLTAFVVLLQAGLGAIKVGATSFSLVLIPIVLGSCILGPLVGAFLGFVFSLIVFLYGVTGADGFTFIMFGANPFATILIIFTKGILAGLVPGLLFKAIAKRTEKVGVVVAALSAPIVNTAIFVLFTLIFGRSYAAAFVANGFIEDATSLVYFLFIGCAGINFIVEFCVNLVAIPLFYAVIGVVRKKVNTKQNKNDNER